MPRNEEKDGPPLDENGLYRPRKPTVSDHVCFKKNRRQFNVFASSFFRDGIDSTVKNNLLRGPIICTNSKCILIFFGNRYNSRSDIQRNITSSFTQPFPHYWHFGS